MTPTHRRGSALLVLWRQHLGGGVASLGLKVLRVGTQFAVSVLLARHLGADGLGAYSFALALATLLSIPAQLGLPGYLVRMTAIYSSRREWAVLKGLLIRARAAAAVAGVSLGAGLVAIVWLFQTPPDDLSGAALVMAGCLVPLTALLAVHGAAIRGFGRVLAGQVPDELLRPIVLLCVVITALASRRLSPGMAMAGNVVATGLAVGVAWWVQRRFGPPSLSRAGLRSAPSPWLRESLPYMLLAGAVVVNHQADILMLGVMTTDDQVGLYRIAVQVADALGLALLALAAVIAPRLAQFHDSGNLSGAQATLIYAHRGGLGLLIPLGLLLVVFGRQLLTFAFKADFAQAATAMQVLVVGKILYASVGFGGLALSMFGLANVATLVTAATVGLNIALNLLLIPILGIEGAAIATAMSALVVNVGLAVWIYGRFKINITALARVPGAESETTVGTPQ